MNDDPSGKTVLGDLRDLRLFEGEEAEFWVRFLSSISAVCKSPCALLFAKDGRDWHLRQEYYQSESLKEHRAGLSATMLSLADRAYRNGFAHERLVPALPHIALPWALAFRVDGAGEEDRLLVLIVTDKSNVQQFNEVVVRTQLIGDIPASYYRYKAARHSRPAGPQEATLVHVMNVVHSVMQRDSFLLACITLVNEIAHRFDCSQVSFGWIKDGYVRTVAISHLEAFDRHSEAIRELEGVSEESCEQGETVAYPKISDLFVVNKMHEEYCKKRSLSQVISFPFRSDDTVVAVLTCEKKGDSAMTASEIEALGVIASQTTPWLNTLHYKHLWFGKKAVIRVRKALDSLLGVEHSLLKAAVILLALALLYSFIGTWEHRVEGSATLRTDAVSYVSAPYDAIIQEVRVREGDTVRAGQVLLSLDTKELLLKEAQSLADTVRFIREADKNRASGALADMKIAVSRHDEAKAVLDKIRYQLSQANPASPFDGIVVEADNKKLTSAPVSRGDILLKVAKLEGMYVHIKIHERDIGEITQGAKGEMIFLGRPWNTYKITVEKTIPVAEVDQREGNMFVVKAAVSGRPESWWRPGMTGFAKIEAGKRKIIWILTHRLTEFVRIYLWW